MRYRVGLLAVVALAAVALWSPGSAHRAAAAGACDGPIYTVTFSGSYTDTVSNPTDAGSSSYKGNTASASSTLSWNNVITGPILGQNNEACYPSPVSASYNVTGSYNWQATNAYAEHTSGSTSCSATLSSAPGDGTPGDGTRSEARAYASAVGSADDIVKTMVTATVPVRDLTGIQSSDASCFDPSFGPFPTPPYLIGARDPNYNAFDSIGIINPIDEDGNPVGPTSKTVTFSDSGSDGEGGTDTVSGTATLSYTPVGAPSCVAGRTAPMAHAAANQGVDILAYQRDGHAVKEIANLSDAPYSGTVDVTVGQLVTLGVDCTKPQKPAPGPYAWTVPGLDGNLKTTSAIASYTIDANSTSLNPTVDTKQQTLALEFIRTGSFPITVKTGAGEGQVTVNVKAPQVLDKAGTYDFCAINTGNKSYESPHHNKTKPPTFGAGLNDQCHDKPGVQWHWKTKLPKLSKSLGLGTGGGRIAMAQLFEKKVTANGDKCVEVSGWPADDASFYGQRQGGQGWFSDGGAGKTVSLTDSDSPFIPLRSPPKTYKLVFRARDYLMYRSDVPGSAWIPISEQTWNFTGEAHFKLRPSAGAGRFFGVWRLVDGSSKGPDGNFYGGVIAPLPQWSKAAVAGGLPFSC